MGFRLGSPEWLRSGWPRVVPLVLLAAMPLALAGPIRAITGIGSMLALVLAVAITVGLTWPFVPALRTRDLTHGQSLLSNGVVLVAGGFAMWILHNSDFDGLVSYVDPAGNMAIDAARHVQNYHAFVESAPGVYQGFVSLYSFWAPFVRVTGDVLVPAQISYLFGGFVVAAVPCVIAFSVLRAFRSQVRAYVAGAVACLVGSLVSQYLTILPNEVVLHMSGSWSHVFGLIPLLALWLVDTIVRHNLVRAGALLLVAVMYRYTYGLNLPDVLFAVAIVILVDAAGQSSRRTRVIMAVLALVVFAGGVVSYSQLVPILRKWGWFVRHDPPRVWQGQVIALAALVATVCVPPRAAAAQSGIVRALRFPFVFGLANVVMLVVSKHFTSSKSYYYQKYSFHAVVLVTGALVVALSYWTAVVALRIQRRSLIGAVVAIALIVLSGQRVHRGFARYQPAFHEYVYGRPYQRAQPWYDAGEVTMMREVLQTSGKAYGGFVAAFWPKRSFTNALFRFDDDFYGAPDLDETPGHCIFWEEGILERLDRDAGKRCSSYAQRRSASGHATLCWACR